MKNTRCIYFLQPSNTLEFCDEERSVEWPNEGQMISVLITSRGIFAVAVSCLHGHIGMCACVCVRVCKEAGIGQRVLQAHFQPLLPTKITHSHTETHIRGLVLFFNDTVISATPGQATAPSFPHRSGVDLSPFVVATAKGHIGL